jgi:hypothetical protein
VLAFDAAGLGIPVLGEAFGNLVNLFFNKSSGVLGKMLPRASTGAHLLPGVMHISDSQIDLLFRRGAASAGDSQTLKRNYAAAAGIPFDLIGGDDRQFHHVIPVAVARKSPLLKSLQFQVDAGLNALPLDVSFHFSSHNNYNMAMDIVMQKIQSAGIPAARKREMIVSAIAKATTTILDGHTLRGSARGIDEWVDAISPF